mgnify:CR=1 FL=1
MLFDEFLGRKVLIIGDVGRGKTRFTRQILIEAVERGYSPQITVIDMAPKQVFLKGLEAGGKIMRPGEFKVRYLDAGDVKTPRLSARGSEELLDLAEHNRRLIERQLKEYLSSPARIIFINDVSIYLQRGSFDLLWSVLEEAETAILNGYYGEKLREDFGTGISDREKNLMERLASKVDVLIRL